MLFKQTTKTYVTSKAADLHFSAMLFTVINTNDSGKVFPLQARLWPRGWVEA